MSGGSHDYAYSHIQTYLCDQMHDDTLNKLMKDIVKLTHDLEWADSDDISIDAYKKRAKKFKAKWLKPKGTKYVTAEDVVKVLLAARTVKDSYGKEWYDKQSVIDLFTDIIGE